MTWPERFVDNSIPLSNYASNAAIWDTCAVGEIFGPDHVFLRLPSYLSRAVSELGIAFLTSVQHNDRTLAECIYEAIRQIKRHADDQK